MSEKGNREKVSTERANELLKKLGRGWRIVEGRQIEKEYTFRNFKDGLAFTNRIGAIAEEEMHHPDIYLAWGKVRVSIYTHTAGGLTELDFGLAERFENEAVTAGGGKPACANTTG
jgi:4a-hydroxytetrahydrobiopterin dehydratase